MVRLPIVGLIVALAILLVGCGETGTALPPAPRTEGTDRPRIDVHAHAIVRGQANRDAEAVSRAFAALGDHGLRAMLLMPPPQPTVGRALPELVAAARSRPREIGFLAGGDTLNPMIHASRADASAGTELREDFAAEARRLLSLGAKGFGEITAHHVSIRPGHPYESVPADHPLLLLLADIAAEARVPIEFHFDVVTLRLPRPDGLQPTNPSTFEPNLAAFERLLAHNRNARIVWAHAGSDVLGHWTPELAGRMLGDHPNLAMSLRLAPGRAPENHTLLPGNAGITPRWLEVFEKHPDRFVIGADQFFAAGEQGSPAEAFARLAPMVRQRTQAFLRALPPDLARNFGVENAVRLYRLTPPD